MTDIDPDDVDRLVELLARTRGVDLRAYKRATVTRRLQRRLDAREQPTVAAYLDLLEVDPGEVAALLDAVLINVTAFRRDEEAWRFLADEVLPGILDRAVGEPIRVWSAGCSTGEEAYTLAMVLAEALGPEVFSARVKIFATDVDEGALAVARAGVYPVEAVAELSAELVDRYFERLGDEVSFRSDLRQCLIFGRHDLLRDPRSPASTCSCAATRSCTSTPRPRPACWPGSASRWATTVSCSSGGPSCSAPARPSSPCWPSSTASSRSPVRHRPSHCPGAGSSRWLSAMALYQ